jgi:hypothetical protein
MLTCIHCVYATPFPCGVRHADKAALRRLCKGRNPLPVQQAVSFASAGSESDEHNPNLDDAHKEGVQHLLAFTAPCLAHGSSAVQAIISPQIASENCSQATWVCLNCMKPYFLQQFADYTAYTQPEVPAKDHLGFFQLSKAVNVLGLQVALHTHLQKSSQHQGMLDFPPSLQGLAQELVQA